MDEATLSFNQWQQSWELKALNRLSGQGAMKTYAFAVRSLSDAMSDRWTLLEDLNFELSSWGWKALEVGDWHGTSATGWAARLSPAD